MEMLNFSNMAQIAIKLLFIHTSMVFTGLVAGVFGDLWLKPFSYEMHCELFKIFLKMSWHNYNNSIHL